MGRRVGEILQDRGINVIYGVDDIPTDKKVILEVGPGMSPVSSRLISQYPHANVIAVDTPGSYWMGANYNVFNSEYFKKGGWWLSNMGAIEMVNLLKQKQVPIERAEILFPLPATRSLEYISYVAKNSQSIHICTEVFINAGVYGLFKGEKDDNPRLFFHELLSKNLQEEGLCVEGRLHTLADFFSIRPWYVTQTSQNVDRGMGMYVYELIAFWQ